MGLAPLLRPGEPSQAPYREARGERQRGSPNREPSQQGPHHAGSRDAAAQEWLSGSQLCWGGRLGEGSLGPEIKGSGSSLGPGDPVAAGLQCSVAGRAQVEGGGGLGAGGQEQSGAVQSQKETAPREGAGGGHCSSSEDSCEMPSSSSFSSFLGLPLGFLPGVVVVFRVLAAPLFLLPFGRPRGLLGVGTSLGSFCKDR